MPRLLTALLVTVGVAGAAIVLVEFVHWMVLRVGRRSVLASDLARTAHRPFLATVTVFAVQQAVRAAAGDFPGRNGTLHALVILFIAAFAWLVAALVLVLEDVALARWRTDVPDNLKRRRIKTQIVILRRVTVAAIVILALGVELMTFPGIRALGASVLASAGLISVIAAVAAQSALGNVFAGLQLAFSDAVRVDDVVVVEGEWGRIEELTLTYVAVQIWDDRRLVLPTTYFTTKPFQNWTRTGSAVLGTAELDVDWSTEVEPLRTELRAVCEGSELWDGRVCVLQVTEATGGMIRLRALVSANDAPALWDLRCLVRERLVAWVWTHQRDSLPRVRADINAPHEPAPTKAPAETTPTKTPQTTPSPATPTEPAPPEPASTAKAPAAPAASRGPVSGGSTSPERVPAEPAPAEPILAGRAPAEKAPAGPASGGPASGGPGPGGPASGGPGPGGPGPGGPGPGGPGPGGPGPGGQVRDGRAPDRRAADRPVSGGPASGESVPGEPVPNESAPTAEAASRTGSRMRRTAKTGSGEPVPAGPGSPKAESTVSDDARVFSGGADAEARHAAFTGPDDPDGPSPEPGKVVADR